MCVWAGDDVAMEILRYSVDHDVLAIWSQQGLK